jgi:tetratricopeptide (TPR) repeat protein
MAGEPCGGRPASLGRLEVLDLVYQARQQQGQPGQEPGLQGEVQAGAPSADAAAGQLLPDGLWLEGGEVCILGLLHAGGMGEAYLAWHQTMDCQVVVNVANDPVIEPRFRREIEVQAKLGGHRHIVLARHAGRYYLVMEYVEGTDLGRLVQARGPLPVADACEAVRQAALGLAFAHERLGIVHRDVKPSNLMVTPDGCVKVLDFGLARWDLERVPTQEPAPVPLTAGGAAMGTPDYMAPEQWRDSWVDVRADIYSLGCTLYHLLAGSPPFGGPAYDAPGAKCLAHAHTPVPPIRERRPDVTGNLATVLDRMLAKEPGDRYMSNLRSSERACRSRPIRSGDMVGHGLAIEPAAGALYARPRSEACALWQAALCLLVLGGLCAWCQAAGIGQDLTPEQRAKLEREARELDKQVDQHKDQRHYREATRLAEKVLAIYQELYPRSKYPQGHEDLAIGLARLGALLKVQGEYAKAEPFYRQTLAMYQALYPKAKYPQGHEDLATSMSNLGALLFAEGQPDKAEPFLREALAIRQALYPKDKHPQGHLDVANSLNNLGIVLWAQGEYAKAEPLYREALAMCQALYPKDKHPQGHEDLANILSSLGGLLQAEGEYAKAEPFLREALAIRQALYPKDKHPQGHPDVARSLNNLADLLRLQGEYAKAELLFRDALAIQQALHPKAEDPQGHPDLALSLNNLGVLLEAQGEHAKAETFLREALATYQAFYKQPEGHPDLATSLNNLASALESQRTYAEAELFYRKALAMRQAL